MSTKTLITNSCRFAAAVTMVFLVACGSTTLRASFDERYAEELRPFEELKLQKAELWELGQEPQVFEIKDQGKVTVRRWALQGWPGEAYVKTRITYENTTEKAFEHAIVWLEVLDSEGNVRGSSATRLFNPLGYRLWPKHTVSTELRAPTNGAHKDTAGWYWRIDVRSMVTSDSSAKPGHFLPRDKSKGGWQLMTPRPSYSGPYGFEKPGITRW